MHEIFEISYLDALGHEVSQSQIKVESNITSESEMSAHASMQDDETLSNKSHIRYVLAYEALIKWQESKEINSFAEPVLLDYFYELSKKYKPSSLRSIYYILKNTIISNHDVNISEYSRLTAFLKEKYDGFQSKMSKLFTADDVKKFLIEAPDDKYLAMKTVLVFGVIGASSGDHITNVKIDHVKDDGNKIIVRIPDAKTKVVKTYPIDGQFAEIVRKYMKLRPRKMSTEKFFIHYQDGKCCDKVIGRIRGSKIPKEIAKFLKLPESEAYTGYSFRYLSMTISDDI